MALTTYKAKMVSCIIIIVTPLSLSTSVCVCVFAEWLHIYRVTGQDSNIQDWRPPILPRLECIFPSNRTTKCAVSTTISYASLSDTSKENCHIWLCHIQIGQTRNTEPNAKWLSLRFGMVTLRPKYQPCSRALFTCGAGKRQFFSFSPFWWSNFSSSLLPCSHWSWVYHWDQCLRCCSLELWH